MEKEKKDYVILAKNVARLYHISSLKPFSVLMGEKIIFTANRPCCSDNIPLARPFICIGTWLIVRRLI